MYEGRQRFLELSGSRTVKLCGHEIKLNRIYRGTSMKRISTVLVFTLIAVCMAGAQRLPEVAAPEKK